MKHLCVHSLGLLLLLGVYHAEAQYPEQPDHTIFVYVDSTPQGARLLGPVTGTETNAVEPDIGITPLTVVVALKWERSRWDKRKWESLSVWSPGNVCTAVYSKASGSYDLFLTLKTEKDGFEPSAVHSKITTLPKPGAGWGGMDDWTVKELLTIPLTPLQKPAAAKKEKPAEPSTTVFAKNPDNGRLELGTLILTSNIEGADVLVDGEQAARTPTKLMLQAGPHVIEVRKSEYQTFKTEVDIKINSETTFKALLSPL